MNNCCNLCSRGGSWNSWRSKKLGCCFPSQTWYFSSYTQQLHLAFFTACFWGLGSWVRICTGIGKEVEGYDNNDHNHMKIPGREFHYNVRSCLMLFQNGFISVIESMGFCFLFIYLFNLQKMQLVKGRWQYLKGRWDWWEGQGSFYLQHGSSSQGTCGLTHLPGYASRSPSDGLVMKWHAIFYDCPQLPYTKQ